VDGKPKGEKQEMENISQIKGYGYKKFS